MINWKNVASLDVSKFLRFKQGAKIKVQQATGLDTEIDLDELAALNNLSATDLQKIDGITNGTAAANKALVADANVDVAGVRNMTVTGSFIIGSADMNEADLEKLDGITNGTGAASKAAVLDASGNFNMPDGGFLGLSSAALASAGSGQSTYAAIADQVVAVTGADGTKGVALPAAAAGQVVYVVNTDQSNVLKVSPVNGGDDTINSLAAGSGVFTMGPGKSALFVPTAATQWYVDGESAIVGTPTEQDMDGRLATVTEINRACDVSTRIVNVTSTPLALTELAHDGKVVTLNKADAVAVTLPNATGSGSKFTLTIGTTVTSGATTVKVARAEDIMAGTAFTTASSGVASGFATAADSDTISFDGSTTGGIKGDLVTLVDAASGLWQVNVATSVTGTAATPFSATV